MKTRVQPVCNLFDRNKINSSLFIVKYVREANTQIVTKENKPFRIFCMKYPDYMTKIMASWMTIDEI